MATCIGHGDSGGPVFSWWDDGPYIVGDITATGAFGGSLTHWSSRVGNYASSGKELPQLVNRARREKP